MTPGIGGYKRADTSGMDAMHKIFAEAVGAFGLVDGQLARRVEPERMPAELRRVFREMGRQITQRSLGAITEEDLCFYEVRASQPGDQVLGYAARGCVQSESGAVGIVLGIKTDGTLLYEE